MNNYMFFAVVFCLVASLAIFSGMVKGLKKTFETDPAEPAYHAESVMDTQSQKVSDIKEKNRRMMDQLQTKMDRMKK